MPDRVHTYVDGESHFIRLQNAWQRLHGNSASLDQLSVRGAPAASATLHIPEAKVFWTQRWSPGQTVNYHTATSGDAATIFSIQKRLREFGLEPRVIQERKMLAQQRKALLANERVIEKAKGVDAAIMVQMLEDAQNGLFDLCNLYTSDADYVPVIEAVKRRGLRVYVFGFQTDLGERSQLEIVPSKFFDLEVVLKEECQLVRA